MGRMIFDLTDEDRELLERVRIAMGARSHAETLRRLIREGIHTERVTAAQARDMRHSKEPSMRALPASAVASTANPNDLVPLPAPEPTPARQGLNVPVAGTFDRKPMQKGAKK